MPSDLDINRNRYIYVLVAILLLGFFLRLYDLEKESLWRDEVYSIRIAELSLNEILKNEETNPPLHFYILHFWQKPFGNSEFSVRFPSLVFGVLSILLTYQITARLFSRQAGVLSALILCVSSFHIYYSQEARAYSLMVFLTLLSNLFYIKALDDKQPRNIVGYIISTTLLTYSHVYAVFIIFAQNAHFLCALTLFDNGTRWKIKEWVFVQAAILLLFVPWLNVFLSQSMGVASQGFWLPKPDLHQLYLTIMTYIGHRRLLWVYILCIPLALMALALKKSERRNERSKNIADSVSRVFKTDQKTMSGLCFLLLWFAAPLVLPFFISKFTTPIYHTRYTISASVAFFIMMGLVIKNIDWRTVKALMIFLIIGLSLSHAWHRYYQPITREQWREAAEFVDNHHSLQDLLVFSTNGSIAVFDYYFTRNQLPKIPYLYSTSITHRINKDNIRHLIPEHERIWAILNDFRKTENDIIKTMISDSHQLEKTQRFRGIEVYLFTNYGVDP